MGLLCRTDYENSQELRNRKGVIDHRVVVQQTPEIGLPGYSLLNLDGLHDFQLHCACLVSILGPHFVTDHTPHFEIGQLDAKSPLLKCRHRDAWLTIRLLY